MEHGPVHRLAGTIGNWMFVIGTVGMIMCLIFGGVDSKTHTEQVVTYGRYGD